ncbi:MAG: cupin domain-containing protein [Cyanobacteriota bacterium]
MDLQSLIDGVKNRHPNNVNANNCLWSSAPDNCGVERSNHYQHRQSELGIDFLVEKLGFDGLQVMDARLVHIAPQAHNEKHRHAHESIFVVLTGEGELQIGDQRIPLQPGSVAYVPRWVIHQSHNTHKDQPLSLLAITDFGLTSTVLGDYDARSRLRSGGSDAFADSSVP